MKLITVLITVPNNKTANILTKTLLNKRIVSCVSIADKINSFYWWKGKIEHSKEKLLILKTMKNKFKLLEATVRKLHPNDVPEIIALDITNGNKDYLNWIIKTVGK
jgi:periplasmic divalent cation tolerance protein